MKATDRFSLSVDVVARAIGEEAVLLDLDSGAYFGLDPVGFRIWRLMESNPTFVEICDRMVDEYDVERSVVEHDAAALLSELVEKKLVRVC